MSENKKAILTKLHAIMLDVEYIQKDGTNTYDKYHYASERAIKEAVYAAIRKHRVVFTLDCLEVSMLPLKTKSGDGSMTVAKFLYGFHDVDSGESKEGTFVGTGNGRDEKGFYAAVTGAIKYCLTSCLGLVTGEESDERPKQGNDPENDRFNPSVEKPVEAWKPITPAQLEAIGKFANDDRIPKGVQDTLFDIGNRPNVYSEAQGRAMVKKLEGIAGVATK